MKMIFNGDVDIYLQGKDALTDGKVHKRSKNVEYLIGHHPDLVVWDMRKLDCQNVNEFNVKSLAHVLYDFETKKIKIVLLPPSSRRKKAHKILAFGVIWDKTFPNVESDFEVFKVSTVDRKAIPFVALINKE